jgi:ATP-dependent helicase HrpB
VARAVTRFDDLVLAEKEIPVPDPDAAAALLAARAAAELDRALGLDGAELAGLRQRLVFLAAARPDLALPRFEDVLLELLPAAASGKRSYAELRAFPFYESFLGALARTSREALDREAPERLEVPSGSRIRIDYADPARPVLAARIQELFGLAATPRLAGGRVPVLLHLLAPNGRPQQVTHDLASFWKNTYPQVKRELAGRYPKHAWPDDPATARPERRPSRRRPG